MPILFQKRIYREDLKANPHVLYVFGDNLLRVGLGGQAKEMRGEHNAVGIATKKAPGMKEIDFFTDQEISEFQKVYYADTRKIQEHLDVGGLVCYPLDGIGTGLSEMPKRCPKIYDFILEDLEILKRITKDN